MAAKINITAYRGDDFVLNLLFVSGGIPVNITGFSVFFTLKKKRSLSDSDVGVVRKTAMIVDADSGKARVTLTNADTYSLLGLYYFDIECLDADNAIATLDGTIVFEEDVTRRPHQ